MLGGRSLGRLLQRSPQLDPDLCGEQGGASLSVDWSPRAGGSVECDCQPVSATAEHMHRASSGSMSAFSGWRHLTPDAGGGSETRGGREDGEADARGEEGQLDGELGRARVSKERKMSHIDLIHIFQDILPYLSNP